MQTGSEWLEKRYYFTKGKLLQFDFDFAKELDERNIKNSFVAGADIGEMFNNENRSFGVDAEIYFNQNFKEK